ncbi:MAG: DUF760 domain-containing protein [Halothece sp.]
MNSSSNHLPESFAKSLKDNILANYIESLTPETVAKLHKPTPEVAKTMDRQLRELVGNLPSENFEMEIETDKEDLARLMASSMLFGYFLHSAQERMALEKVFQGE